MPRGTRAPGTRGGRHEHKRYGRQAPRTSGRGTKSPSPDVPSPPETVGDAALEEFSKRKGGRHQLRETR